VACTVLLPWIPGSTIDVLAAGAVGEVVAIAPFSSRSPNIASADFVDDYRSRWGMSPPAVAVYARDAVQLVVDGLRAAGLSRTALRDRLAGRTDMIGLSGPIRWDSGGGNTVPPVFARQLVPKR
jgi:ABC-type branched-subunit amino acid transport system substrate-binding protein